MIKRPEREYDEKNLGLENCRKFWELDGDLPVAKYPIPCPSCRSEEVIARRYRFHTVPASPSFYRCVVMFKCTRCSMVITARHGIPEWAHGVIVPRRMFELYVHSYRMGEQVTTYPFSRHEVEAAKRGGYVQTSV